MVGRGPEKSNPPAAPAGEALASPARAPRFALLRVGAARALGRPPWLEEAIALTAPGADGGLPRGHARFERLADGSEVAIRHYRRGGLFARVLGDRYGPLGFARAARELALYDLLAARGIPTLEPIAAVGRRSWGGLCWRLDLLTRALPGATNLGDLFVGRRGPGGPRARRAVLEAAGRAVRALHDGGVVHPDLNARNLLVVEDGHALGAASPGPSGGSGAREARPAVLVIDLDRARARRRPLDAGARAASLARLLRSARKLTRGAPHAVTRADLARFLRGYAREGRAARRALAVAVEGAARWRAGPCCGQAPRSSRRLLP